MDKNVQFLGVAVACALGLLAPVSAFAYLSPDQVFGGAGLTLQQAPPNMRDGTDVRASQQEVSATHRAAAQESLTPTYAAPKDDYVAPVTTAQPLGLFDNNTQYQRRQQRIDNGHSAASTIIISGNGDIITADGQVLHSGAPRVTSTGPESVLAFAAMILAGICTFAFAHIRIRRLATTVA